MLWSEVRKWAKGLGYDCIKNKEDGKYYWALINETNCASVSGVAPSVSKLAKAIYNHYTNDKWLDHQKEYEENKENKKFSVSDYGTQ